MARELAAQDSQTGSLRCQFGERLTMARELAAQDSQTGSLRCQFGERLTMARELAAECTPSVHHAANSGSAGAT